MLVFGKRIVCKQCRALMQVPDGTQSLRPQPHRRLVRASSPTQILHQPVKYRYAARIASSTITETVTSLQSQLALEAALCSAVTVP